MRKKIVIMPALIGVVLALSVALFAGCDGAFLPNTETQGVTQQVTQPPAEAPTEPSTEPPTEPSTEPPTEPMIAVPQELAALLERSAMTVADLQARDCAQLITVESSGSTCSLNYYSLENYEWVCDRALSGSGYVGRNGVSDNKREGDMTTPAGLYGIGDAFYIYDAPQTGLNMFEITPNTYWVDDPESVYYNRRVEGVENKDWNSAEHMVDYQPAYLYGFVINYNIGAVYNKGSAIFFHVSTGGGTAGCVSTNQSSVLQYLALLDKARNPHILIL